MSEAQKEFLAWLDVRRAELDRQAKYWDNLMSERYEAKQRKVWAKIDELEGVRRAFLMFFPQK